MRTIKFRAKKTTNDVWVYGSLVYSNDLDAAIYFQKGNGSVKSMDWVYVNTETVGQFTELFDANQKEIYEGDIIRLVTGYERNHDGTFVEKAKEITVEYDLASFNICSFALVTDNIEVIGNIHDNPELINK